MRKNEKKKGKGGGVRGGMGYENALSLALRGKYNDVEEARVARRRGEDLYDWGSQ